MKGKTRMQQERERADLTKAALARKTEMQQGTIGLIESRRFIPYESQLTKIATALEWGGNPEDLLEEVK